MDHAELDSSWGLNKNQRYVLPNFQAAKSSSAPAISPANVLLIQPNHVLIYPDDDN
jgi:hypothetical protein